VIVLKIDFNASEILQEIQEEIEKIPEKLETEKKEILRKSAKIIKANVIANLPKSDLGETATNYDGTPYIHMKDDVKTSIRDDKAGNVYAVIRGGKYTGYKWHILENGSSNTKAIHFVEKAMKDSEEPINTVIDEVISKVVE